VGGPPAPACPLPAVRRQHLLPVPRHPRLLGATHHPRADGSATTLARRLSGPGLQHRPHRRVRAHGVGRLDARRALDRRQGRRPAGRVDVRLQYAHADAACAHPGHSWVGAAARLAVRRPRHQHRAGPRCPVAGCVDGSHGLHVRIPPRVRLRDGWCGAPGAHRRLAAPAAARTLARGTGGHRCGRDLHPDIHPVQPGGAGAGNGTVSRERVRFLRHPERLPGRSGTDSLRHLEWRLLPQSSGRFLPRLCRRRACGLR
jgi:hypothetical protein